MYEESRKRDRAAESWSSDGKDFSSGSGDAADGDSGIGARAAGLGDREASFISEVGVAGPSSIRIKRES